MRRTGWLTVMYLATFAGVLGCAEPNSVVYSAVNAPPRAFARRSPASVEVFLGRPPARPHVDVGMFEAYQGENDDGTGRSTEDMLHTLRLHAALRGCDALQVMGVELAGRRASRVVRGVCEMYTDPQALEADKHLTAERLPSEGHTCVMAADRGTQCSDRGPAPPCAVPAAGSTAVPVSCLDPLVCLNSVCASPYR